MATIYELMGVESKYDFSNEKTYEGSTVPRVTSVLSFIDNEGLIDWANAMGRKGLDNKKILESAAKTGTIVHEQIEHYLKDGLMPSSPHTGFKGFVLWYVKMKTEGHVMKVLGQEQRLSCEWFTGTYDLLMEIDGKVYLIDFKTSNHVHYKYCMQLAAYRYMLRETKNINIDGCIILQLNKTKIHCNEFKMDFSIPEDLTYIDECEKAFMYLVVTYHKIMGIKKLYPW